MDTLSQFLYRLCFGLAAGMLVTPPRKVTSGFYRVHAYVLMGMAVAAAALAWRASLPMSPALVVAAAGYLAAVFWFLESGPGGLAALLVAAMGGVYGATIASSASASPGAVPLVSWLGVMDVLTSGLLLGFTLSAMLLGHWYLNAPEMDLDPFRRLILLMGMAVIARALFCGGGFASLLAATSAETVPWTMLILRWSAGLIGTLFVAVLAWKTLEVPNTQSATGILYVGVLGTCLGELTSMLLSRQLPMPV